MKKILILLFAFTLIYSCNTPSNEKQDKAAIISVLRAQENAWSKNDIDGYMKGYWKSDSLKFYGSNGKIAYGWNKTLSNYKKRYPTPEHTGTLKFKVNDITRIENESYYVMGEYHLTRTIGNANGIFMIIFRKINGEWKVVADTTP
jgi:hypothetical protein